MTRTVTIDSKYDDANFRKSVKANHPDATSCGVCGRAIVERRYAIHCVEGSMDVIAHPDDDYDNEAADMGWWYIGSECLKRVPRGFVRIIA